MPAGALLPGACAVIYAAIALLVSWRWRRISPLLLAGCCLVTALWATALLRADGDMLARSVVAADLLRAAAWFAFIFHLYRRADVARGVNQALFLAGGVAGLAMAAAAIAAEPGPTMTLPLLIALALGRLTVAVVELLLIENLYFNLPQLDRWHIALPSVLLGGLACFDIIQAAGWAVNRAASGPVEAARTVGMIVVAPLLLVAALRGHRWKRRVRLSRTAVFHSATMILSGSVLLALGAAGEISRRFDLPWGWVAQASLLFAGLLGIGLVLTSGSARSRLQRVFVDHFFAERYDYRQQWLACIRTLSGDDGELQGALGTRAVRTMASVVDSPAGALLLRDGSAGPFAWAGSWNLPAVDAVSPDHPLMSSIKGGTWIAVLGGVEPPPLDGLGPLWLAVPLLRRGEPIGLVLLAPPRAPFPLEREVFALLRIVAQEVATYIAEQRATQTLLQTRQLHEYGKRFAFVAHDIKNVSSQLALLSANAKTHISNPEFQKDMIETVDSSVRKITALLQRLERPAVDLAPAAAAPTPRLEALVGTYSRVRRADVVLEHDGSTGTVAMGLDMLETAVTHLLNNAVEASDGATVVVRVRHEARQIVVEVADTGPGMSAEFARDQLFQPFSTSKSGGSGIGAFQAREMVREAGGELAVLTEPGRGTTMRLLLPRTDTATATQAPHPAGSPAEAAR